MNACQSPIMPRRSKARALSFASLNRYGVTGVIDPGGLNLPPQDYRAVFALARAGQLSVRVNYSLSVQPGAGELEQLRAAVRNRASGDLLRFNGIGEIITWGMYNNDTPSDEQRARFEEVALWAAQQGLTLTLHWNRDRSIHHALDVFERVNAQRPLAPLRWSIAHIHDASPQTLQRMKALGLGWLTQNAIFFAAPSFLKLRGQNLRLTPPLKTAIELGLPTGAGTDAHRVMWYNPFVALQWMVDGRTVAGLATRDGDQRLTRLQALALYTRGSAWFAFDETNRGTLETGKWADLALLDGDYLAVPEQEIASLRAALTMVGGRIVYEAQALTP
jgi:predicted amidohydrolase YtcJ